MFETSPTPSHTLPATYDAPPPSLRAFALAALAAPLDAAGASDEAPPEHLFLLRRLAQVTGSGLAWPEALRAYERAPAPGDLALFDLARTLGLTRTERLAVALAAAVEDDVVAGRAVAYLQAPLGGSRPTLGLLDIALADLEARGGSVIDGLVTGAALRSGLLTLGGEGNPLPERTVSLPLPTRLALAGHDGDWPGTSIGVGEAGAIPLPPSTLAEAERHAQALSGSTTRVLVIRSGSPAEARAVAQALAQALQRRPAFIEDERATGLTPWLLLRRLLPVFVFDLAPGERRVVPPLPLYTGPLVVILGPDGSIEVSGRATLSWRLSVPSRSERQALWEAALGQSDLADELAQSHRHGSGRIAHLGHLARHYAVLRGETRPSADDIVAAARAGEGAGLETLAQPLPQAIPDAALVTVPTLRQDLELLAMRCRARDGLVEGLGVSTVARYTPGVRALLVGPSGTGKTLAAGWLATRLGMPLYRVDLAAVTSKYIGETEKNLAQLLAQAEQAEVILLFDEADSMFGKRTDVKEANDRFANAQTNYLLQRIETYDGIVLLTSNSRNRFDDAFARRLDMIIEFPLPGPEERRALWLSHLGDGHTLTPQQINQLAGGADLAGGHIRNAVITAAVLAHGRARPIEYADVVQGLQGEYQKLGRQMPLELTLQRYPVSAWDS